MARTLALAAGLALLLACKLEPGGRCVFDSQCRSGLECTGGLCVVRDAGADLGASCAVDSDCVAWGACRANVCVLEPGACVANGDCPSWQSCTTDHVCALATGKCASNADCVSWKTCSLSSYTCALLPNRCDTAATCKTWQTCDATNTCLAKAGFCDLASQCGTWQSCDTATTHKCIAKTGYCDLDAQCQAWESCDAVGAAATHRCVGARASCTATVDCGPFRTCQSSVCAPSDGSDVLLVGELTPGLATTSAVSLVGAPGTTQVGFPSGFGAPRLDAAGAILYVDHGAADVLVRLVPDAMSWDATNAIWQYPADPGGDDLAVATPSCTAGAIDRWIVRAGTGEVFHSCDPDAWFDSAGAVRFTEPAGKDVVAWNAIDAKLVLAGTTYTVVDAAGTEHAVVGLPSGSVHATKTHGAAFWIALANATSGKDELWSVDAMGTARSAGVYPPLPAAGPWALDDSGRAYVWAAGKVERGTADAAASEPLYDSAGGASVWTTNPATWWVTAAGPIFVTGP